MPEISGRIPFSVQRPVRAVRPASSKLIFLSCEGSVTEEQYFKRVSEAYSEIKTKIQFISVAEDVINIIPKFRTLEQKQYVSKNRPKQLVERIEQFKLAKNDIYEFEQHPDDEFWIITDVDQNWSDKIIDKGKNKTYKQEWEETISICNQKGYHYAVSNPFFEIWLLLHHDEPIEDDTKYAVTDTHEYEPTSYYRERLRNLGYALKNKKQIKNTSDYDDINIRKAVERAEHLHIDKLDLCPKYYATTVYILIDKILQLVEQNKC